VKRRAFLALALVFVGPAFAAPAFAADPPRSAPGRWLDGAKSWVSDLWRKDANDWLERIGPALVESDYQGTLVTMSGTSMETVGVYHAYDDGHERMRLVTLTGPHREVIRNDKMVMCIGTGIDSVGYDADIAGRWNPAGQFAGADELEGYQASLAGEGRVADRDCQVVDLRPRDSWRYGYRLWLDKETGMPLRIALVGEGGRTLEQMAFTDIRIGQRPDEADLQPSTQQGLRRVQTLRNARQDDPGWRVHAPPPGFELRSARRLGDSVQLLYSDGLANVSVYIEPMRAGQRGASALQRGAVNVRSLWQDGRRVVAIGKVPAATVDLFARNLQSNGGGQSAAARRPTGTPAP
jgi:sigma-E factor negative regulatory protein RseB